MTIQGRLLDLVDTPLPGLTVEVWLDGQWMTNVTTDENGTFTAVYPVPAGAELGGPVTPWKRGSLARPFTSQASPWVHGLSTVQFKLL